MIGDGSVGKTSLRQRYMGQKFVTQYIMTIGADFAFREIKIDDKKLPDSIVRCQIWDLAGQVNFARVRDLYYTGSNGILLVYDCTNPTSYANIDNWLTEAHNNIGNIVPIVLIANKIDLREKFSDSISKKDGEKMAENISEKYFKGKIEVPYIETSAKTGENVDKAFQKLAQLVIYDLTKELES